MSMDLIMVLRGQYPADADMTQSLKELTAQAELAQKLGYWGIAIPSHFSAAPFQHFHQTSMLAYLAAKVQNMKLISAVNLLPLHKPMDIAEQYAAIDVMTGGNFIFGSGIGYREVEFKGHGAPMAERGRRFDENLEAVRRLWTEDTVDMVASHFELDGACCPVKPLQKPHPPFWIGANADVAIKRAARAADAWIINPHNRIDTILRQMDIYKKTLDECGKPMPKDLPFMREMFVAKTRAEAIELARPYLEAKYKAYHEWGQDKAMPKGDDDLGLDFDDLLDDRFVFGSADEVAEQIVALQKPIGFNLLFCGIQWIGMPHEQVIEQMHIMAEDVLPKVRQGI
ncbi:MAG: LLM class flavin-dependent oxidoreductase [Rickettsiales bacterium]|jgi:alkanesulfonate monooxygenase SsuD/methylene tetrahydromethanopterin reductase-like flavin-dependent oxidoreductase (luciferase family)